MADRINRGFGNTFSKLNSFPGNGTPLFTTADVEICTNLEEPLSKDFSSGDFSQPFTLDSLNINQNTESIFIQEIQRQNVKLRLDPTKVETYATFGSFSELVRVSLENIVTFFPGSLYVPNNILFNTVNNVENYTYFEASDTSAFSVKANILVNQFEILFTEVAGNLQDRELQNPLRNLTVRFGDYAIFAGGEEYPILQYTAPTDAENGLLFFVVEGNPFGNIAEPISYHIRPRRELIHQYFQNLPSLQSHLLNQFSNPIYTALFWKSERLNGAGIVNKLIAFKFPLADDYNIDVSSNIYDRYVEELVKFAEEQDQRKSDIILRQLTGPNIHTLRLEDVRDDDFVLDGSRVGKLLTVYGREFDEILKYIDGIKFANTVTYDGYDNTPDELIPILMRTLGWDSFEPFINLISELIAENTSQNVSEEAARLSTEMMRRLILETWWVWKSKGTRKATEFILAFFNIPEELVTFNEYVYVAQQPLDVKEIERKLALIDPDLDLSDVPVDDNGFPLLPRNSSSNYFQMAGGWYRETGGINSVFDLNNANNPHIGSYDCGDQYISQLICLISDFTGKTVTTTNEFVTVDNLVNKNFNEDKADFIPCPTLDLEVTITKLQDLNPSDEFIPIELLYDITGLGGFSVDSVSYTAFKIFDGDRVIVSEDTGATTSDGFQANFEAMFTDLSGNPFDRLYFEIFINISGSCLYNTTIVEAIGTETDLQVVINEQLFSTSNITPDGSIQYDLVDYDNDLLRCFTSSGSTICDPNPTIIEDVCGCPLNLTDNIVQICIEPVIIE